MVGRKDKKGRCRKAWGWGRNDKHITFPAVTKYLHLHTKHISHHFNLPLFPLGPFMRDTFLSVSLTQTWEAYTSGNSPVQLSSTQA